MERMLAEKPRASVEKPRAADTDAVAQLVAAARGCFMRDGVRRTRMAAVAQAAGMVRQTVYAFVSSREELIELALAARLPELTPAIVERTGTDHATVEDAFVDVFVTMAAVVREDPEFVEYAEALGLARALRFLTGDTAAQDVVMEIVRPQYERAATEGVLRPGISLPDVAFWARTVLAPPALRADVDDAELRRVLRKFALPALLTVGHAGA
jgi:AcrR family transcriptional regulator